jgi:hypothetical protein
LRCFKADGSLSAEHAYKTSTALEPAQVRIVNEKIDKRGSQKYTAAKEVYLLYLTSLLGWILVVSMIAAYQGDGGKGKFKICPRLNIFAH